MKLKTMQDLINVVNEMPFIWTSKSNPDKHFLNQFILKNEKNAVLVNFNPEGEFEGEDPINTELSQDLGFELTLLDWIETSEQSNESRCLCPFIQMLQQGCKCGAIVPYEMRKQA